MLRFEKEKNKDTTEEMNSIRVKYTPRGRWRQCGTYLYWVSTSSGDFAGSVQWLEGKEGRNPTFTSPNQHSPVQAVTVGTTLRVWRTWWPGRCWWRELASPAVASRTSPANRKKNISSFSYSFRRSRSDISLTNAAILFWNSSGFITLNTNKLCYHRLQIKHKNIRVF